MSGLKDISYKAPAECYVYKRLPSAKKAIDPLVAWLCRTSTLPDRKGTTMRQKTAVQQEKYQETPTYLARVGRRCKAYRAQGVDRQVGQGRCMRSWLEALPLICCLTNPNIASSTPTNLFDCNARGPMKSGILDVGFVAMLW